MAVLTNDNSNTPEHSGNACILTKINIMICTENSDSEYGLFGLEVGALMHKDMMNLSKNTCNHLPCIMTWGGNAIHQVVPITACQDMHFLLAQTVTKY